MCGLQWHVVVADWTSLCQNGWYHLTHWQCRTW